MTKQPLVKFVVTLPVAVDPLAWIVTMLKAMGYDTQPANIAVDDTQVVFTFVLPPGKTDAQAEKDLLSLYRFKALSYVFYRDDGIVIVPPPTPDKWWSSLIKGDRIKLARPNVTVYYDPNTSKPWSTLSDWRTMDVFDVQDDWIKVKEFPPYNLWVNGHDVVKV